MTWTPERLKQFRKTLGMNQSQFAAFVGVNMFTIFNWEGGKLSRGIPEIAQKLLDRLEREEKEKAAGVAQPA